MGVLAIAGPTHEQLPPFDWASVQAFRNVSHIGQPPSFPFDWQLIQPN